MLPKRLIRRLVRPAAWTNPLAAPAGPIAATPHVDAQHRTPSRPGTALRWREILEVEATPMMLFATLACAALTVVTFLAIPRAAKARRLARLRAAQEE